MKSTIAADIIIHALWPAKAASAVFVSSSANRLSAVGAGGLSWALNNMGTAKEAKVQQNIVSAQNICRRLARREGMRKTLGRKNKLSLSRNNIPP